MQSVSTEAEVPLAVGRCVRTLNSSADTRELISALQTLSSLLADEPGSATNAGSSSAHHTRALQVLVGRINAEWVQKLTAAQRRDLWDGLFLRSPPEEALLVLTDGLGTLSPSAGRDHLVHILEEFLRSGGLDRMLWSYCQGKGPRDSPQFREALLGRLAGLPDLAANRLHPHNRDLFLPERYCALLATALLYALENTCQALRDGCDCSLVFVAQVLGKVCIHGNGALVFGVLAPRLSLCTRSDVVWQRVSWKLMENIPEGRLEPVVSGMVLALSRPAALSRVLGNLVLKNKKAEFLLTHKMLLLQYHYKTAVLRTILGYLAADRERRPLLIQVLKSVCVAWSSPTSVRNTPVEQQLYVSRVLLLSASLLRGEEITLLRSELLQCMLGGMQCHLDSGVVRLRRLGMVVGECLSSCLNLNGTKLTFEDEETEELRSLMTPQEEEESDPEPDDKINSCPEVTLPPQEAPSQTHPEPEKPAAEPDSDLDSDDDLAPYDMSCDQEVSQAMPPRYLRDCLDALMTSDDPGQVELSLRAAEGLVRKNISTTREVSVQMTKVLLHMEDKFSTLGFLSLRHTTMVALVVTDCIPVTKYLTTEFYSLNYSLRQRLDMLEVLAMSAQELSQPIRAGEAPTERATLVANVMSYPGDDPVHWRQIVEQRIQGKTRRISKGITRPPTKVTANRYAPVAGHFFFPLLQNYDRPQVTFDLLGSDHLVLGRLIHTMGLLVHLAVNAPVAPQMCRALLDFVWALRYHTDQMVRRGALFATCSVFLSMPSESLLLELSEQLSETRAWLADVAETDPDADCRSLAIQSLVLLEKSLKKQLEAP
ncbi:Telomere length regulation protein TEL2 [Merluccius polli]|uniref:Telomere length regulation protein TEL2 homolog n=1 Tax=Merluccius polli TaxID=89951 RepID=A0AA47M7L5_MERPO|nr:Telomere length regulation protein TEL2 [Merluccius polli]